MKEPKYKIGEVVFLITDIEQSSRMITGILFRPNSIIYYLSSGATETEHYEMEIATQKSYV